MRLNWRGNGERSNPINSKLLNVVIFGYISGISFKYLILQEINYTIMAKDKGSSKKDGGKKTAVKSLKEKRADKKEKQDEKRRKD